MPLTLTCGCGKSLRVGDALAGKKIRCPACREICAIPASEQKVEEEALNILLSGPPTHTPLPPNRPTRPGSLSRPGATPYPPTRVGPRPIPISWRPKVKKEEPAARTMSEEDGFGKLNAGVISGILL